MHSFYRDPARRPMVMSSGAVACLAAPEMPCPGRVDGLQRQNRAVCAGTKMPAHILPGTRGYSPSGHVLVRTYVSRASSGSGWQAAGRQAGVRSEWRAGRAQARSLGARARQRRNPARLAGRQRLIGLRAPFRRSGKEETCTHAHMHMYMCMLYSDGNSARDNTQTRGHAAMS